MCVLVSCSPPSRAHLFLSEESLSQDPTVMETISNWSQWISAVQQYCYCTANHSCALLGWQVFSSKTDSLLCAMCAHCLGSECSFTLQEETQCRKNTPASAVISHLYSSTDKMCISGKPRGESVTGNYHMCQILKKTRALDQVI